MSKLIQFQFAPTGDGSPTLEFHYDTGIIEKMHHGKGAFSETLYIYKPALIGTRILSIGLGLGYNEIMTAAYAVKEGLEDSCFLMSFEKETFLSEQLLNYIQQASHIDLSAYFNPTALRDDFMIAYEDIFTRMATHFGIDSSQIKATLAQWIMDGRWVLKGEFSVENGPQQEPFHGIFFDAFSDKMSPEFWTEDFLLRFLDLWSAPSCILATYAAKGVLTRALKAKGFSVELREGFGGKKESTLATRSGGG